MSVKYQFGRNMYQFKNEPIYDRTAKFQHTNVGILFQVLRTTRVVVAQLISQKGIIVIYKPEAAIVYQEVSQRQTKSYRQTCTRIKSSAATRYFVF